MERQRYCVIRVDRFGTPEAVLTFLEFDEFEDDDREWPVWSTQEACLFTRKEAHAWADVMNEDVPGPRRYRAVLATTVTA